MNKILFIAVHPDDETLGCGGSILKHRDKSDEIYWLILTKANSKINSIDNFETIQKDYISSASMKYGFNRTIQFDFLETELDKYMKVEIINNIKKVVEEIEPNMIFLPNRCDAQSDHRIAFDAIYSCTKNFRFPYIKKILMYEVLSETEFAPALPEKAFIPNVFIDITPYIEKKLEIMRLFSTEQMEEPYPRAMSSIKALNRFRGCRIGVEYAEAFMLLHEEG